MAGHMPPEGCFNPPWNRKVEESGRHRPRDCRYVSARVFDAGTATRQMRSAYSILSVSSRSDGAFFG